MDISQLPTEIQQRITKIQSAEGDCFDIDQEIANSCNTIKNLLRGPGKRAFRNALGGLFTIEDGQAILKKEGRVLASLVKEADEEVIISLHDVKSSTLGLVLDFCRFHNSQTLSEKETKNWNAEFVRVDQNVLCELASASYYLDIKPLVNLTSRAIATQVSGKSSDEIRETFHNINSDLYSPQFAIRHRLQKKVNRKKSAEVQLSSNTTGPKEDERSVDDLLLFINNTSNTQRPPKKKKQQAKKQDELTPTPPESPGTITPPVEPQEIQQEPSQKPKDVAIPKNDTPQEKKELAEENQHSGISHLEPALLLLLQQQCKINITEELVFLEKFVEMDPFSREFDEVFEEEEKTLDPEFKARVDREVAEWSRKLEQIYGETRNSLELISQAKNINAFFTEEQF